MATLSAYLIFDGNCETAFNFYKDAFGKEFNCVNRFGEMPPHEGMSPLTEELKNKIMHMSLPISAETILMGSDNMPGMSPSLTVGNNFSISVGVNSKEEADKLFKALSAGGKVTMPLEATFWGAYFGMLTDQFGVNWMVNCDLPK